MKPTTRMYFGALLALALAATAAYADPVGDAIADKLAPQLPAELGVAHVHVPASLAKLDPQAITAVEAPRDVRAGRPSVKVIAKGRTIYVPVTLAPLVTVAVAKHAIAAGTVLGAADITIEHRAFEGAPAPATQLRGATVTRDIVADAAIGAHDITLAPPSPRGTQVAVEIHRGSVHITGAGILELAARTGEPATVRLAFNQTVVHGVMTSPSSVVVGDMP